MKRILKTALLACVLMFFVSISIVTETISTYTKTLEPMVGNITLEYPEIQEPSDGWFYNAHVNSIPPQNGEEPIGLTGYIDGLLKVEKKLNYVYDISVTTDVPSEDGSTFCGLGLYVYGYASSQQVALNNISLQIEKNGSIVLKSRNYSGQENIADDYSGGTGKVYHFLTNIDTLVGRLKELGLYHKQTMMFSIYVEEDEAGYIRITPTVNRIAISEEKPSITFPPIYSGNVVDAQGNSFGVVGANDFCLGVRIFGQNTPTAITFDHRSVDFSSLSKPIEPPVEDEVLLEEVEPPVGDETPPEEVNVLN